jgi:hypothetical protein
MHNVGRFTHPDLRVRRAGLWPKPGFIRGFAIAAIFDAHRQRSTKRSIGSTAGKIYSGDIATIHLRQAGALTAIAPAVDRKSK